jgi:Tfp pilus assembly protein PilN
MANGKWVKGKDPALWFWLMAGLRPAIMLPLVVFVGVRLRSSQKQPEERVIQFVPTASDAK